MLVSSFCASRFSEDATRRKNIRIYKRDDDDAQNERDGAAAAQLRRSNSSVAVQHYNLALKWSSHRRVPFRAAAPR